MFLKTDWDRERVTRSIKDLEPLFKTRSKVYNTTRSLRLSRDKSVRGLLEDLAKSTRKRLRSPSPDKKYARRSLAGVFDPSASRPSSSHNVGSPIVPPVPFQPSSTRPLTFGESLQTRAGPSNQSPRGRHTSSRSTNFF